MIDLSHVVGLTSNDVSTALLDFFRLPAVAAVLALVIALALYPYIHRSMRWIVLGSPGSGYDVFEPDDRGSNEWVSMPGDLPGLTMEYEVATGYGFSWSESTRDEMNQAAAESGDYSLLQFSWEGSPSHDLRNEDGEVVARVYDPS